MIRTQNFRFYWTYETTLIEYCFIKFDDFKKFIKISTIDYMLNKIIIIYIHIIILFIFKVIFMYKILNLTKFNKEKLKILLLNIYKKYVKISL